MGTPIFCDKKVLKEIWKKNECHKVGICCVELGFLRQNVVTDVKRIISILAPYFKSNAFQNIELNDNFALKQKQTVILICCLSHILQ